MNSVEFSNGKSSNRKVIDDPYYLHIPSRIPYDDTILQVINRDFNFYKNLKFIDASGEFDQLSILTKLSQIEKLHVIEGKLSDLKYLINLSELNTLTWHWDYNHSFLKTSDFDLNILIGKPIRNLYLNDSAFDSNAMSYLSDLKF